MYKGTSSKAIQSQEWLTEALIRLMEKMPYEKILIRDICREADLSRQTFYNLFESREEILHFYLRRTCQEQFRRLSGREVLSIDDVVNSFVLVLEQCRPGLNAMLRNNLTGIIFEEVSNGVALFSGRFVRQNRQDAMFSYSKAMLSGALTSLLLFWLQQEEAVPAEQLTQLLHDFLNGKIYRFPPEAEP